MPSSATPLSESPTDARGRRVRIAAALGAWAGLAGAALDVASTIGWLSDRADRVRLALALPALGASCCALLAAGGAFALGNGAFSSRSVRQRATRVGLLLAIPCVAVAHLLFTGGKTSRLPAQWLLQPASFALLLAASTVGALVAASALERVRRAGTRARAPGAGALAALALALHAADHRVLPRLYEYLHAGLGALTALALGAAAFVLAPPGLSRKITPRGGIALVAGALVALPASMAALDRWDNVRAELFDVHAPFVRHLAAGLETARAIARPARTPGRRRAPADVATARTPGAALPTLPGAHVLLITVDALRDDRLDPARTPALWSLARDGIRFARTYAQAPHSSYSISSLHTGEYLHETVALGQAQPLATLAGILSARGYRTAALYTEGIFFTEGERLAPYRDTHFGFRRSDHGNRRAREQADAAMREIDETVRLGEPPSLLWVHFFDAHEPYAGTGSTPLERYDGAVREVDAQVGRLVSYARTRLSNDIVVCVTADHGEEFGEHGGVYHGSSLYEEQVRVPWVLSAPGAPSARVESPVELVDVAPTLLAMVGVPPATTMRGRDARALLAPDAPSRPAFGAVNTRTMIVRWPYKLVTDRRFAVRELFDLGADPGERRNLAGADPARAIELDGDIAEWLEALGRSAAGNTALARARLGDRSALPDLVALSRDRAQPDDVRREALEALGALDDAPALDAVVALLTDPSRAVSDAAACALGSAGRDTPAVRTVLRDAVVRDEPATRARAALALARLGDTRALAALEEALATGDEPERLRAVDALGALRSPWAAAPLLAAMDDDHLRYRAVVALGLTPGGGILPALRDALARDRADDVRANAAAALALAGDREDWPWLARLARDGGAQVYAASALGKLGVVGRELSGWDARDGVGEGIGTCEAAGAGPVWGLLGARGCRVDGRARLRVRGAASRGACVAVVRARGSGELVLEARGREWARVGLDAGEYRETRIPLGVGECEAAGEFVARSDGGEAWVAHVVVVGR